MDITLCRMKKLIALAGALAVYVSVNAQMERMPFSNMMNYTVHKITKENPKEATTKGSALFNDDFEGTNYLLADKWELLRSDMLSFQQTFKDTDSSWFHCTPQSFYGNGSTYIKNGEGSTAISFTAPDFTWLITRDTFAIPTEQETFLKFWLWYSSNFPQGYITYFYVMTYDIDSQTMDTLLYYGKDSVSSIPNQYKTPISLSLSKVAGKNVRIAFVYENRNNQDMGIQLAMDDVTITNINIPDIEITAIPFKYSKIPLTTFDTLAVNLTVNVNNIGTMLNDTVNIAASCNKIAEFQANAEITDTLESGELQVVVLNPQAKLTPTPENYTFRINATTPPDTLVDNNTDSTTLEVSSSIYATDWGVKGGISFSTNTSIGNMFKFQKNSFIDGVEIGWAQNTEIPESEYPLTFLVRVLEVNPAEPAVYKELPFEIFQKDFSANGGSIIYFFTSPIYCYQGFSYYILISQLTETPLGIGYDGNPYGSFWKVDDSYPLTATLMANQSIGNIAIRAITSKPVDNPTVIFNIKNEQKEPAQNVRIKIYEIDSTLVTDAQGQTSIKLNNGLYSYSIDSTGYSSLKKEFTVLYKDLVLSDSLAKTYLVKFKVTDTLSNPLANAQIIAYPFNLTTNDNGEDSAFIPSGIYPLNVLLSGYKMKEQAFLLVQDKDTLYTITMIPDSTTYTLTVMVKNNNNESLPNAQVYLMDYGTIETNSEGICTYNGVDAGPITGIVYAYNYISGSISANIISDSTITVNLNPNPYIATFYVTSKGNPIINAEITIEGIDTLYTGLNGYAQSNYIPFGYNIPYTVKVKDYHAYTGTFDIWNSNVLITVNLTPLDANVEQAISNPTIFPNPTSNFITISNTNNFTITIYNLNGKMVYLNSKPENTVDISFLPKGMYIVKLNTPAGLSIHKIVKL